MANFVSTQTIITMGDLKGLAVLSCVLRALGVKQSLKPPGKFELHGTMALTCDDVLEHAIALDSINTQLTINSPTRKSAKSWLSLCYDKYGIIRRCPKIPISTSAQQY